MVYHYTCFTIPFVIFCASVLQAVITICHVKLVTSQTQKTQLETTQQCQSAISLKRPAIQSLNHNKPNQILFFQLKNQHQNQLPVELSIFLSLSIFCTKPINLLPMFSSSNKKYMSTKFSFNQECFHPSALECFFFFIKKKKKTTLKEEKLVCEKLKHKSALLAAAQPV